MTTPDFTFVNHGSVWSVKALTPEAIEFAEEHFKVPDWAGEPADFTGDWRAVADIIKQLVVDGFCVAQRSA